MNQEIEELKEIMAEKYAEEIDRLNELRLIHQNGDESVYDEISKIFNFLIITDEFKLIQSIQWTSQYNELTRIPTDEEIQIRKDFEYAVFKASQDNRSKYDIKYKKDGK